MIENPSTNFGYMIKAKQNQAQAHFASVESGSDGPQLIIEYQSTNVICQEGIRINKLKAISLNNGLKLFLPFNGSCEIAIYNLKGNRVYSTKAHGNNSWYSVLKDLPSGTRIIRVKNGNSTYKTILNDY